MRKEILALRIDDIFTSTKEHEVYGRETIAIAGKTLPFSFISNFLFFKYLPGFRKRLPYREIAACEWKQIFAILKRYNAKLTVGITAVWVEKDGGLRPFFEKFPKQAEILKSGMQDGFIEIANHGYTHCVKGKHLPRLFSSNRNYHREFWDWVGIETHKEHIEKSQEIISSYFGCRPLTFIPPGNVWTQDTERFAAANGIRYLSSREIKCPTGKKSNGLFYVGDNNVCAFHDRELILNGIHWMEKLVRVNQDKEMITVKELGSFLEKGNL